jgi:hypothetical protein
VLSLVELINIEQRCMFEVGTIEPYTNVKVQILTITSGPSTYLLLGTFLRRKHDGKREQI